MILVAGSLNADLVVEVPRIAAPGETVLGPGYRLYGGGKGANQALAAARAGATVAMAGRVGRDGLAPTALENLRAAGVDTALVLEGNEPTGAAFISVAPSGENAITVAAGANAAFAASDVPDSALAGVSSLLVQLEIEPAEVAALAGRARRLGVRVLLNAAPARPLPEGALGLVDLLVVNAAEATAVSGVGDPLEAARALRSLGPAAVVVTLGGDGLAVSAPGLEGHRPAYRVTVVDTTAAGDAFVGALAAALDRNEELEAALSFGMAAGALAATRRGAQPSLPTREEIEGLLQHGPH